MAFSVRPGPITLLSITSDQRGFHFVAIRGEALHAKGRLQGYPNALVKLDVPLKSFFAATTAVGTTWHWALGTGARRTQRQHIKTRLRSGHRLHNSRQNLGRLKCPLLTRAAARAVQE